jgi:hypothetical protein
VLTARLYASDVVIYIVKTYTQLQVLIVVCSELFWMVTHVVMGWFADMLEMFAFSILSGWHAVLLLIYKPLHINLLQHSVNTSLRLLLVIYCCLIINVNAQYMIQTNTVLTFTANVPS